MASRSKVLLTIPKDPNDNYRAIKTEREIKNEPQSREEITFMISVSELIKTEETKGVMKSDDVNSMPYNARQGREGRIIPRLSLMPKRRSIYTAANHQMKSSITEYMGYLELNAPKKLDSQNMDSQNMIRSLNVVD